MKFLATGQKVLAITFCLATGLLAAPTLDPSADETDAKIVAAGTTEKRATTTTIAGVEVKLNSAGVPILGQANGVGVKPSAMSVYEAAGKKSYAAYNTAIAAGAESADTTTTKDVNKIVKNKVFASAFDFPELYRKTKDDDQSLITFKKENQELGLFTDDQLGGFSLSKLKGKVKEVTVTNKNTIGSVIVNGIYDTTGYAQFAFNAFKDNDKTDRNNKARVPVNELSWQSWTSVAGTNANNLQVIFLMNIENEGFWKIAAENYAEAGMPPTKAAVWEPKDAKHTVWFERLLGSDNINGKMIALTNHHNAIGNKKITRVVTIPRQAATALGATGSAAMKFTAALVLG